MLGIYTTLFKDPTSTIVSKLFNVLKKTKAKFHRLFTPDIYIILIGNLLRDIVVFCNENKYYNDRISNANEQIFTTLGSISSEKQGSGNTSLNYSSAFCLNDSLFKLITDKNILIDSATELQKYLENLKKSIEYWNRLILEEKTLTDKKRLEISNDALFYIFQTCKHFDKLAQDFLFLALFYETLAFLTIGEHLYEDDKTKFSKEYYSTIEEERKEISKILADTSLDSINTPLLMEKFISTQ